MWEPWKGALYNARRLLILGESCYDWTEDGVRKSPEPDHPVMLVKTQLEHQINQIPFMFKLTRSVTNEERPSFEQRESGWRSVGFTNFVPCSVGYGHSIPPTSAMWARGSDEFRPLLLESLKPRNVIVLGMENWRNLPPSDVSLNDDVDINSKDYKSVTERVRGYHLSDGSIARLWSHWHPRAGASWTSIRDAIEKAESTPEILEWKHAD